MGKIAFVFPGQGSQTTGMGKDVFENYETANAIFQAADDRLGFSLSELIFGGSQEQLTLTTNAQPALLTTSIALFELLIERGIQPDYTAGHSLGEYSALVASGAFDFEDAVYAVRKRGEFMEACVPAGQGSMAAVLGMDKVLLKQVTDKISADGHSVGLANINCPGQIVISGTAAGVEAAGVLAKEQGAKRVIPLDVSGPFHSELMEPAAERMKDILDNVKIGDASIPVISNVSAQPIYHPDDIKEKLIKQIYSPVLWEDSVHTLLEAGVDIFVEVGPGKVLGGLIKKIDRTSKIFSVSDEASLIKTVESLRGENR